MRATLQESLLLAGRNLRHIRRVPEKLADATIQPIIFTIIFVYVFGSAVSVPGGGSYHEYVIAGMMAQGAIFPAVPLAIGVSEDRRTGFTDRLRALPISRASALTGRVLAQLGEGLIGTVVFLPLALIAGWRVHTDVPHVIAAEALIYLWISAFSWVGILVGLVVRDGETANTVMFTFLFPIMFLSGIFIPVGGLPTPLRQFGEWSPLTVLANAVRHLFGNPVPPTHGVWPLDHSIVVSTGWAVLILAAVVPLAVRRFRRMESV